MATNTSFDPQNSIQFEKSKLFKNAEGVQATCTAGTTTNIDLTLSDDHLITGGNFIVIGAVAGDKVDFQVIHPVAGVVGQFITNWYVDPEQSQQGIPGANYPAKLVAGLTLRVVYRSVGASDVWVAVNYNKEKVLE